MEQYQLESATVINFFINPFRLTTGPTPTHRRMSTSNDNQEFSMSKLSLHSSGSHSEDWDRSESDIDPSAIRGASGSNPSEGAANLSSSNGETLRAAHHTPRNSIHLSGDPSTPSGKRSLSELLRLHAEKGTDCTFSTEEAARLAEVLGEWVS